MHPIERLRYVARSSGDPADLAEEAADALRALSEDPRALLTASRRLLDAHPECGPLWWLAARLLCAVEPEVAAGESRELIAGDVTAEELAASLPGAASVVASPTRLVLDGLSLRPDCSVRLVASPTRLRAAVRRLGADLAEVAGFHPQEAGVALEGATLLLVEPLAASSVGVLVAAGTGELLVNAGTAGVAVWLVVGQGRVLPPQLFEACAGRAIGQRLQPPGPGPLGLPGGWAFDDGDDDDSLEIDGDCRPTDSRTLLERHGVSGFALAVTPDGPQGLDVALSAAGCPTPPELTRLAG